MIHDIASTPNRSKTVLVIMGSTRPSRHCAKIAAWILGIAQASTELGYELVDLNDWPLPTDDEPGVPATGVYAREHTRAWSRKVASADAYVFVTPQYNWGYPAPLKNALDHLYKEWRDKPAVIISYGGHGGDKCAAQLRQVLDGLHMHPVATMPGITLTRGMIEGAPVDPERDFQDSAAIIRQSLAELVLALEPTAP